MQRYPKELPDLARAKLQLKFAEQVKQVSKGELTKDRHITNSITYAMVMVFYLGLNSPKKGTQISTPLSTVLMNEVESIVVLTPATKEQLKRCSGRLAKIAYQAGIDYE